MFPAPTEHGCRECRVSETVFSPTLLWQCSADSTFGTLPGWHLCYMYVYGKSHLSNRLFRPTSSPPSSILSYSSLSGYFGLMTRIEVKSLSMAIFSSLTLERLTTIPSSPPAPATMNWTTSKQSQAEPQSNPNIPLLLLEGCGGGGVSHDSVVCAAC